MTNDEKKIEFAVKLESRRYNPDYVPAADHRILTIRDKLVGSLQNYVIFSGLPKSGKSTFMAATIASALHPSDMFNIKINLPKGRKRICYIDTESSDYDFYRQMERIKNFAFLARLPDRLDAFSVREDNYNVIKGYIQIYLENNKDCGVLIIDGLLDLILNFNDEVESRKLVQWLKYLTKVFDCLIIGVLHLGKKEGATLGHLGSATDRYAVSTLEVVKDKEQQTFNLQSRFMRSDIDFEPVCIKNFNGTFQEIPYEATIQQNFKNKQK
jgi:AAA domain